MGGDATSDHLRLLEIKTVEEELEAPISQFLKAHGSSLISLCIYCSQEDQLSQINFSRISSGLKALRLPWCFIPGSLRKKLKLPNLEYLEFAEGHASDEWEEDEETGEVPEINDTVKWVMELPKLRSLWFHVGEVGLGWDYFVEKWEKCCQKGIAVNVLDRGHPDIVEDDFIKSEHFPRGQTVENFARMRVPVRNNNVD
ncbi:hypothetical protein FRC02_006926 [Tulasnella sp. 418]|nr:hypothetical protein FRC02_006926 [Tulasnella sp. 418]